MIIINSTDENPSLRIESFAKINLRGVSTKLYFNLIFTMQTYKELKRDIVMRSWSTNLEQAVNNF